LLYTNAAPKPKASDTRRFAKFNRFDYILVPNQLRKDLLVRSGVAGEKIFVLGSPRYCTEWLEQNKKILPRNTAADSRSPQKLKVVLMASKPQCQVDGVRLKYTLGLLAELAGVDARIKPHTRSSGEKNLVDDPRLSDASLVLTAQLCEWADVMLVVGSSVITEALMRGRPALYLKYLHDNTTLFEDLGACWIIHDEVELKNALLSLQADKTAVPYGDENVAEYLSEVVYGRKSGRDVLHDYEQFIVGCASKCWND
jgi:UDP-N-acetylglucosamine 2-epimerase